VSCLPKLMGEATARAERPMERRAMACMFVIVCLLIGPEESFDVDAIESIARVLCVVLE
jgi:hypothetical protein